MLESLDYAEREQAFAFIGKALGDFVPEDHLLRQLEKVVDFKRLCAPLRAAYASDVGRPAVHPEVLVRALLIGRIYQVPSFRQLCRDLSYNLAYRYFCHIPLQAEVFDHSTISRFLERIGGDAFEAICKGFDRSLREAGLLSDEDYLDSTLIAANASSDGLRPTTASVQSFAEAVKEVNGIFLGPCGPEPNAPIQAYQDEKGRLPLPESDPDARWGRGSRGPAILSYKLSVLSEDNGFITGHRLDLANVGDHVAGTALLSGLERLPASLAADKAYSAGEFRRHSRQRGICAHVPLPQGHPPRFLEDEGFRFNPFALICPEGQSLRATHKSNHRLEYRSRPALCAPCPRLDACPAARKHGFTLGEDSRELVAAAAANRTPAYRRAMRRRRCVAEGNMASLKRLGLDQLQHRGLKKVGAIVSLSVLAHNLLRLVRLVGRHLPAGPLALFALTLVLAVLLLH